jgi:hypothetical protein
MARAHKRITRAQLTGQKGINLIEKRVLDMGFLWYPTGTIEAGIDGTIEIRDDATGDVLNNIVQVQSKATEGTFPAETADGFEWTCDERDLDYWMRGNAPVILVVTRPNRDEAYWVSVKDYFRDPTVRQTRKVRFDKCRHRFDEGCKGDLIGLAVPNDAGIYLAPLPRRELLYSNLLPVASYAERLYIAETDCRQREDVWREMQRLDVHPGGEYVLSSKRIMSVHDLREYPWDRVCDVGTVDEFDIDEWAQSGDPELRREFVRLLNCCLREKCRPHGVRYSRTRDCYYFAATKDLRPRIHHYQAVKTRTSREVFKGYPANAPSYYRHSAFAGHFRRFEGIWYLEVTPTYYFTYNGYDEDRYYADKLMGIKRLERNDAVTGQLVMWAELLGRGDDLFRPAYPYLSFRPLPTLEIEAGIDDEAWRRHEEDSAEQQDEDTGQLGLFPS